ncbi:HAMP domain-containing sensor histidine kinase [Lysinibacillus sp. SGAir0095]|uniref:sensor histidine kinase n=1 Tax=Lysinibacillus sp. SGAir0095 TaxID=2070463 RepID=UPI0010CCBA35|nr:HAMP domain-containing sensor histidine kinase [Lysinibacillus sp. SGAir0095]QCR30931.1 hypothetical protein C1N55_01545 [Lysinibacillus sp. SGAir0095]
MKSKNKLLLILFLITWSALAVVTFINHSHNYLFKSYFESDYFQSSRDGFIEGLGKYVLAPFDAEKAKEQINVTQEEIENYRNYYGSLSEQVENIRSQYIDEITNAEQAEDTQLKEHLVAERDAKIADITKNFESDEYVEEKIRKQKEQMIDSYANQQAKYRNEFLREYKFFAFNLVNVDTEEKFESGQQQKTTIYSEKFGEDNLTLTVDSSVSIDTYGEDYNHVQQTLIQPFEIQGEVTQFEGTISVPKTMAKDLNHSTGSEYKSFEVAKYFFYIVWLTGIVAIIGLFSFAKPSKEVFRGELERLHEIYARIPVDVQIVLILIGVMVSFAAADSLGYTIINSYRYTSNLSSLTDFLVFFLVLFGSITAIIMGSIWTWDSIKTEEKMKKQVSQAMLYRLADGMKDLFLNRSVGMQAVGVLTIAFLTGIGFIGAAVQGQELVPIFMLLFFFIALPAFLVFLRHMGYLNRIMKQTQEMAEGRLTSEIKVKGKSIFSKHAANLNDLREGVKTSMSEQAKSERLKTELITNVGHDLRTPLTSIITYTDLLKNPNLTEDERKQYIDVLDKKSARLKTLIEDLFEVSKMASGNIEVTKQRLDLTQLLKQSIGEHEEEFAKSNFELRVSMPEQPLFAYVDGQKMWRVIDNLIVNALKYSLEGTRIYITLKHIGSAAEFTVKNVSKYELNENVEELTERFKRADASRHTDGSGLGLAIAQSIVDIHNGRLSIDLDGDLFKVTVSVPAEY